MRAELVVWLGTVDPALDIDVAGATEALLDVNTRLRWCDRLETSRSRRASSFSLIAPFKKK